MSLCICLSVYLSIYPTICLFVCLSIYLFIYLPTYLSLYLFICLSSISLSICLSVCLSIHLSVYLSLCLFVCLSMYLSICLSIYLFIYLSIYLSVCLSIYLSIYLFIYVPIYLSIYGSTALVDLGQFLIFFIFCTVDRTTWTSDQPVARPLPTHRTAQTQNKRREMSMLRVGFEPTIPMFERTKPAHAWDRVVTVINCEISIILWNWSWCSSARSIWTKIKCARKLLI
jgi:hypothetical protein